MCSSGRFQDFVQLGWVSCRTATTLKRKKITAGYFTREHLLPTTSQVSIQWFLSALGKRVCNHGEQIASPHGISSQISTRLQFAQILVQLGYNLLNPSPLRHIECGCVPPAAPIKSRKGSNK